MASDRPVREAENRLEHFNADRERLLAEVERRVVARRVAESKLGGDASLEYVLNDVAFSEIKRLEASHQKNGALDRWKDLSRRLMTMSEPDKEQELRDLVRHYGRDVVGNFDPRVYKFATGIGPSLLNTLFSPTTAFRQGFGVLGNLDQRIHPDGEVELAHTCAERGTLIITPTHSSNMDSPAIGFGLMRAGLPPTTYGAGKNLFTNPFISFFMRNLGAYRVDRRLRFELYKDVLKEYSTVLLEHGYHSLFFPGGTRCRSNIIERHLKLGLLGTSVTAYKNMVREGQPNKRLYVVPATINYRLVLEAETLIDDYLAETGKSRYIITDDEFSRVGRIVEFFRKILAHEGSVVVRFGRPFDPFGNDITDDGESIDRAGRHVDPASFVRGASGEVTDDDQRDAEYTRALGRRLAAVYPKLTVFHSTHLVARVMFDEVARRAGTRDIYRLMRVAQTPIPKADALAAMDRLRARIAATPAWGAEHPGFLNQASTEKLADGVRGLSTFHTRVAVEDRGDSLYASDMKLVYYYQNRTAHIPVEAAS
ncbi:MAG TPA: 1-acyl-sn-glycerol-3-phosphate acyltransferase [Kofleriaceae bacterium]